MPSLDDERSAYRQWGWTWTEAQEPHLASAYPGHPEHIYTVSDIDVHGESEGDDLWTYLMAYLRTGQQGYLERAQAWARYFIEEYRQCAPTISHYRTLCYDWTGFDGDHAYGYGLVAWYEYSGDARALATVEAIAGAIEIYYAQPKFQPGYAMAQYGLRRSARHLLTVTRLAEVTQAPRWLLLRDRLLALLAASPDWSATYGMYFVSAYTTNGFLGAGAYEAGIRGMSAFHLGILAEALTHAYRLTQQPWLRERLIAMAQFAMLYGLDPRYSYTGSFFGVDTRINTPVHLWSYLNPDTMYWDPVYTTSLVNLLVVGAQLTGDTAFATRALFHWNQGSKGTYGSSAPPQTSATAVHHFVDTIFESPSLGQFWLAYNKGELLYTYQLFAPGIPSK